MNNKIKLIVFDWAGTIVDYGCRAPLVAFLEAFKNHDLEIDEYTARLPMGAHKRDHVKDILEFDEIKARLKPGQDLEALTESIYQEFARLLPGQLPIYADPIPGVVEAFAELRAMGIRLAGTSGYLRSMMNVLLPLAEAKGVLLDKTLCADEVTKGRPSPEACHALMNELGPFQPEECLKIGDTVADVEEGTNSGFLTLAVSTSGNEVGFEQHVLAAMPEDERIRRIEHADKKLRQAGAFDVLNSVAELPQWLRKQGLV